MHAVCQENRLGAALAPPVGVRFHRYRALRIAAISLGALLILVLAVAGAAVGWTERILKSGELRGWINGNPEKLFLDYGPASSSWPGRLRVRGLRLRGRDANVEWELRIDDCRLSVSLRDLFRKRFHATRVDARGLTFRLRQRLDEDRAKDRRAEFLPPIEGFPPVPLRGRPPVPPAGNANDLWGVQIDRLAASPVREIWIDSYRYSGNAVLTGRLFLRPRREAAVGPATLEWKSGTLSLFGKPAASPVRARIECRIAPFDRRVVRGSEVWDSVSARADWSGELAGLEFFGPLLGSEPQLSRGKGRMSGRFFLDHGKGEARIALSAEGATARYAKETLRGTVSAELRMKPWRPALGVAEVAGSSLALRNVSASSGGDRTWWGGFEIASGRLRSVRNGLQLAGRVTSRCRDARPLYTLFGVGLPRWTRGLMELEDFSARADVDFAPRLMRVVNLDARGGNFRVLGEYSRSGDAREGAFLVADPPFRVGVEIEGASTRVKLIGSEKWFQQRFR
jgi:hypothetical protein